jgi:hypothetical protein
MTKMTNGRPRSDGAPTGLFTTTELYALLCKKLPQFCVGGELSVPRLAQALGYTKFHMYRVIEENRVTRNLLTRLTTATELNAQPLMKKEDLLPFAPEDIRALFAD